MGKKDLRDHIKLKLSNLTDGEIRRNSGLICEKLIQIVLKNDHKNLGVYLSKYWEVDLTNLIKWCWENSVSVFLPTMQKSKILKFHIFTKNSKLIKNHLGIYEVAEQTEFDSGIMDSIIVPMLAFDKKRNRLGRGGGYYDRTLSTTPCKNTLTIGVAHSIQEVRNIPTETHDIKLDFIITEKQTFK